MWDQLWGAIKPNCPKGLYFAIFCLKMVTPTVAVKMTYPIDKKCKPMGGNGLVPAKVPSAFRVYFIAMSGNGSKDQTGAKRQVHFRGSVGAAALRHVRRDGYVTLSFCPLLVPNSPARRDVVNRKSAGVNLDRLSPTLRRRSFDMGIGYC
ncbi:hypothetical protein GCM10009075_38810 [Sphingomonas trueperi]